MPDIKKTIRKQIYFIIFLADTEWAELMSGVTGLLIGGWLANPYWYTFSAARTYAFMAQFAPEPVWAIAFILFGLIQLIALIYNHKADRKVCSLISTLLWGITGGMFIYSNAAALTAPPFFMLAFFNMLTYWRLTYGRRDTSRKNSTGNNRGNYGSIGSGIG